MNRREYSLIDVINYAYKWKWFFISIIVISIISALSVYNFLPRNVQVSSTTTIYPIIPGMTPDAVSTELSEYMWRSLPGVAPTGSGYTISVPSDLADKTRKSMAGAIDGYEADLRTRLAKVRAEAEAEYKKNPYNEAVYNSYDKFKMLPETTKLIFHIESTNSLKPNFRSFLLGFIASGLFIGILISAIFTVLSQWRSQKRD